MSTSLPFDVQEAALRTIPALRDVRVTRYGYAVEYDAIDPSELSTTMESRRVANLFLAGQVNGTSGYEEAAGQGILAGINAARAVQGKEAISLGRDQAFIGVMADDLANKPFDEPYRMLTSRAEFRLLLRPSTADARLSRLAYDHGLIDGDRFDEVEREQEALAAAADALQATRLTPGMDSETITRSITAFELLRRPESTIDDVARFLARAELPAIDLSPDLLPHLEETVKYGAFVERERREVARRAALEHRGLPDAIDYASISGLRIEAQQKLTRSRPRTLAEASRLSGVTPADIAALLVHAARGEAVGR
jgi:tRNA uridine 5-carboxymethylaminomethyl modification enzyme